MDMQATVTYKMTMLKLCMATLSEMPQGSIKKKHCTKKCN